jgi:manganese transport protein
MKRLVAVALGILTAIGGFVDIGELVTGSAVGARFEMRLAWATVLALVTIVVFAEMSGRVAAVSQRPVFDLVRERLGPRLALANLLASFVITLATVAAEIGGVALAIELATSLDYLLWVPLAAVLLWLVIWRVKFDVMENVFGLLGLALLVVMIAVWRMHPDWSAITHQALHPSTPAQERASTYWYYAIAMFGAGVMPYEVFFFSSGAIEERWTESDLVTERLNVFIGFPIGMLVTLSLMLGGALVLAPRQVEVASLYQAALPTIQTLGPWALVVLIVGFFACTFGAALETMLSCGYMVAQFFGWPWGKGAKPREAARFHSVVLLGLLAATAIVLTRFDPVRITEFVVVLSAAALPLTYFPVLVVANDPEYMGEKANSLVTNALGVALFVVLVAVSLAAPVLMVVTKAGS